jgi:hypothetical protein
MMNFLLEMLAEIRGDVDILSSQVAFPLKLPLYS